MPFVELSTGATFHYEDEGSGEPLVAIHPRLGTARYDFASIFSYLTPKHRVLGPSLRGCGQSTPKPRDFPHNFYHRDAADVLAFMDALGIESAHLIGFSDGGETALVAAGSAPDRFRSVAVWGAVGYFGPIMSQYVRRSLPPDEKDEARKVLHDIDDLTPILTQWVIAMEDMIARGGDVSLSLAPNIACPLLLMLGDQDKLNPQEYGQRFVDAAPDGRLVMFQTGHACHEQAPETFKQVLLAFLESVA